MTILHIDSSISGDGSASRELTRAIVTELVAAEKDATVQYRDLVADPLDHLTLPAFGEPASQDALAQFKSADTVVIGAPMYNFGVPSQLKAWIDRIAVAGETFRYTENGPEGLMGDKRVIVAISRGNFYGEESGNSALEHTESYLRGVLQFLGVTDITFVVAEGIATGEDARKAALTSAHEAVKTLLPARV